MRIALPIGRTKNSAALLQAAPCQSQPSSERINQVELHTVQPGVFLSRGNAG